MISRRVRVSETTPNPILSPPAVPILQTNSQINRNNNSANSPQHGISTSISSNKTYNSENKSNNNEKFEYRQYYAVEQGTNELRNPR
jgi:hypothetical protein